MKQTQKPYDDEIDLKEIIKKLWDRKNIIVAVTVIGIVISLILALMKSPRYEVSMIVEPGILFEEDKAKDTFCVNIENKLTMRVFRDGEGTVFNKFSTKRPKGASILKIFRQVSAVDVEKAKLKLSELFEAINADFADQTAMRAKTIQNNIAKTKNQLIENDNRVEQEKQEILNMQEMERVIFLQLQSLSEDQSGFLQENQRSSKDDNGAATMLYIATLQQQNTYSMVMQEKLVNVKSEILQKMAMIERLKIYKTELENELQRLTFELQIQEPFFRQVSEPMRSVNAIGMRKQKIVILGAFLGLLCGVLLAFVFDMKDLFKSVPGKN